MLSFTRPTAAIGSAVAALGTVAIMALPATPAAQASTCRVSVTHTATTVTAHRTAGTCRIEAYAVFASGRHDGPDKTSGTSTAWYNNERPTLWGWVYS